MSRPLATLLALGALLPGARSAGAQAQLLQDLRPGASAAFAADPGELAAVGSLAFFAARDEAHGRELWSSDGTPGGTGVVRDIAPGIESSDPQELTAVGGVLFFVACPDAVCRLWSSDGTAGGTQLVGGPQDPRELTAVDGTLFFVSGADLWSSDGTPGGTAAVASALAPEALIAVQGLLFFGTQAGELWTSDGTPGGTQKVLPTAFSCEPEPQGGCRPLLEGAVAQGAVLFFRASDGASGAEPWSSDGTLGGTARVKDARPGAPGANPTLFTVVGTDVFFAADDGVSGRELWISDGSGPGTQLVADLTSGGEPTTFGELAASNGLLFFVANGRLFRSDGTALGTAEVVPAPGGPAQPSLLTDLGGTLLFRGLASTWGLWRSDGSAAGTALVAAIDPGCAPFASTPCRMAVTGGLAFLGADDGSDGREAWASDGTGAGTVTLTSLSGTSSDPSAVVAMGGAVYFVAADDAGLPLLWRSDASPAGTQAVSGPLVAPRDLTPAGSRVFFAAGSGGRALWLHDTAGTRSLASFAPVPGWQGLSELTAAGSRLFFAAADSAGGEELWTSDGTAAGTQRVADIRSGSTGSEPLDLVTLGSAVLFSADDGLQGRELWRSDGTAAGTQLLKDLAPGTTSGAPRDLTASSGRVFFAASAPDSGAELWTSDGTTAGTQLVADLTPGATSSNPGSLTDVAGTLFFTAADHLWRADGSAAGTLDLADLTGRAPSRFAAAGGRLFFVADDPATGPELWTSDGSGAGTGLVADLEPGAGGSDPRPLGDVAGTLLLSAATPATGAELWASDGTAAGTLPLLDIFPGPEPSSPGPVVTIPGGALFAANDGVHGREPWSLETADLSLAVTESADPVGPGIDVTYVATVANAGPRAATGVVLSDELPVGATLTSVVPGSPVCAESGGTLTCALGTLAPGQQARVTLVVRTFVRGAATHAFSVASDRFDHRPANGALALETTVSVPTASVRDATALEKPWPTSAAFLLTLSWPTREAVSVAYATADGTATAGQDYAAGSGSLRLAPGATRAAVRVRVLPDRLKEGTESFQLLLTGATNAAVGDGSANGRILDDDVRR